MHGSNEDLTTNPVVFEADATKAADATKVGAGAAGGAAGGGVVLATRGKEVEIAEGAPVTATLSQPLTIRIAIP